MVGVHMSGGVGGHLVACLCQPIGQVNFDPLGHTPSEVEVCSGEGRAGRTYQIVSSKHLSKAEDVVGDMEALGLAGLEVPHPLMGNKSSCRLRLESRGIFRGSYHALIPDPSLSSAWVNKPILRDHSLMPISYSWLNSLKVMESVSRSVVGLR